MVVITEDAWILQPSIPLMYLNQTASCLGVLHHFIVFAWIIHFNTKSSELDASHVLRRPLLIWTLMAIGFYIPFQIGMAMSTFSWFAQHLTCYHIYKITWIPYWMGKYSVWMYSVMRIKVAFYDAHSALKYPDFVLKMLQVAFTTFVTINICLGPIFGIGVGAKLVQIGKGFSDCIVVLPLWTIGIVFFLDTVAVVACYALFQYKIKVLLNMTQLHDTIDEEQRAKDLQNPKSAVFRSNQLRGVLGKYKVLLVTVVLSSWIASTISTFNALAGVMATTDTVINMWCLIMFDARFRHIYQRVYGSKIFRCCFKQQKLSEYELDSTKWVGSKNGSNGSQGQERSVPKPSTSKQPEANPVSPTDSTNNGNTVVSV